MGETSNMAERRRVLQQQRIAVTLFLVLACFLLCHVPYIVYSIGLVYAGQDHMPIIMNPIVSEEPGTQPCGGCRWAGRYCRTRLGINIS